MNTGFDTNLQDAADYYLRQLRTGDFEFAFHGLTDMDSAIVHPLIAAYHAETSPAIRGDLLRIIWEFRTPLALPLLAEALRDRHDTRWRHALDGLVTLASPEAIQILDAALPEEAVTANPDSDYTDWVREALEQTQEAHDAKSNATGNA